MLKGLSNLCTGKYNKCKLKDEQLNFDFVFAKYIYSTQFQ